MSSTDVLESCSQQLHDCRREMTRGTAQDRMRGSTEEEGGTHLDASTTSLGSLTHTHVHVRRPCDRIHTAIFLRTCARARQHRGASVAPPRCTQHAASHR
mmetsp:Transcript_32728/g.81350  ORF Transcript_32728/g.81350 Transcript_32728/m.81350 type:complete len:100 (-) Transcript_32728:809-1108(-)